VCWIWIRRILPGEIQVRHPLLAVRLVSKNRDAGAGTAAAIWAIRSSAIGPGRLGISETKPGAFTAKQANITIRFLESIDATLIEPLNIRSTCAPVAEESPTVPAPIQESAGDSFPTPPSPDLPYDADVAKARKLDDEGKIPVAQQEFDILAWQAFIVALPDLPADD
jgi:hypothetical protein